MMKRGYIVKHTQREVAELLESDDELPDSYDETPNIPAYLDNDRFRKVKPVDFDGVYQKPEEIETKPVQPQASLYKEPDTVGKDFDKCQNSLQKSSKISIPEQATRTLNGKNMISKGVLTKRDIFLVKSIEECTTDATLLWFINFLNYKTVIHQRSCLVADVIVDHSTVMKEPDFMLRYYFKLVVLDRKKNTIPTTI